MELDESPLTAQAWLCERSQGHASPVSKESLETRSWFAQIDGWEIYAKLFPYGLSARAEVERSISGANLHPSIVPLRKQVRCSDGLLHLYDKVHGENLVESSARCRFAGLYVEERTQAFQTICRALGAICEAGFVVVDWYEGNTLYDFEGRRPWLFDWELCREGKTYVLDRDRNYGSSRLMAPEEFVRGSSIDERTLVFNLGRFALLTLPDLAEPLATSLARATHPSRDARFPTVRQFATSVVSELALTL